MPDDLSKPIGPHADKLGVIHAPWRESYMKLLDARENAQGTAPEQQESVEHACFFRRYWMNPADDATNRVIVRTGEETRAAGQGGMILLNAYPYINGHLLVALGESRSRLMDYSKDERALLWSLVDLATELCELVFEPQGMNVGMNIGRAGGAGVPEHLHVHVMPRWAGDTNFSTTVAGVRVVSTSMDSVYDRYCAAWETLRERPR